MSKFSWLRVIADFCVNALQKWPGEFRTRGSQVFLSLPKQFMAMAFIDLPITIKTPVLADEGLLRPWSAIPRAIYFVATLFMLTLPNALTAQSMNSDQAGTTTFNSSLANEFTLTAGLFSGFTGLNGTGTVTLSPPGPTYPSGTVVTVTATAASNSLVPGRGSAFVGWEGGPQVDGFIAPGPPQGCSTSVTPTSTASCQVTMTSNLTVTAKFKALASLTTSIAGTGTGTVTRTVQGDRSAAGPYVTNDYVGLTATASPGSVFAGWSGNLKCSGIASRCIVVLDDNFAVVANFTTVPSGQYTLTANWTGNWESYTAFHSSATVTASPAGPSYAPGTVVTLTATVSGPNSSNEPYYSKSVFEGWTGACSGRSINCKVRMNSSQSVNAKFGLVYGGLAGGRRLSTSIEGTGDGEITASPAGMTEPPNPTYFNQYNPNTIVTLTAKAVPGSVFAGWTGACSGTRSTCVLTMNTDQSAAAIFKSAPLLRVSAIFPTSQSGSQSYLRFYNTSTSAGTVTVSLSDLDTGKIIGPWISPNIPAGVAAQYFISDIESGIGKSFTKPNLYSISVLPTFTGYFQHVLWNPVRGTLTNLSTCDAGVVTDPIKLNNVHSSKLDNSYPSSVVINNTGTDAQSVTLSIFEASTGNKIGSYVTATIPDGASVILPIKIIETGAAITPTPTMYHYIIKAESPFTGFLQHLVNNTQADLITDMTTVCTLVKPE